MSKIQGGSKEYFNRLDSLRFLAFFLVLINHFTKFLNFPSSVNTPGTITFTYFQVGDLGVAFFFVLSGFLITYLLEKERLQTGLISLKNFYVRRILRIWPLYFLVICIILILSASVKNFSFYKISIDHSEFFAYLLFVGNFFKAFYRTSNEMIAVLWSVAVEEQFYLVWPIIFVLFRKYLSWILGFGIIISMIYRYHFANNFEVREFHTFCVMVYLLVGAWAGLYGKKHKIWFERNYRKTICLSFICFLVLVSIRGIFKYAYPPIFIAFDGLLFGLIFVFIILSSAFGIRNSSQKKWISKITEHLGAISYGLYVYHLIALSIVLWVFSSFGFDFTNMNFYKFAIIILSSLILVISIASLSFTFIEKPFLELKEKFIVKS